MDQQSRKKELVTKLAVLLVVAGILTGAVLSAKGPDTAETSNDPKVPAQAGPAVENTDDSVPATAGESTNASGFKDGTYSATGNYSTPENTESITVKVTLKDGIVIDTSATASMKTEEAKEYAGQFIENYKPQVVGKNISTVKLSRVSGSSLTSQGFNRAIDEIEAQARS